MSQKYPNLFLLLAYWVFRKQFSWLINHVMLEWFWKKNNCSNGIFGSSSRFYWPRSYAIRSGDSLKFQDQNDTKIKKIPCVWAQQHSRVIGIMQWAVSVPGVLVLSTKNFKPAKAIWRNWQFEDHPRSRWQNVITISLTCTIVLQHLLQHTLQLSQ